MKSSVRRIAVAYLARGADVGWRSSCKRFLASYKNCSPGVDHNLYIIFKGYRNDAVLQEGRNLFKEVRHTPVSLDDNSFDIGAYIETANQIEEDLICMLNTSSEILAENWLQKLAVNLASPNVGLVGATGSYESLNDLNQSFPVFPNPHLRSNAFMIRRESFCSVTKKVVLGDKLNTFFFESGPQSLTRQILDMGQDVLLVGRNGRGYSRNWWPTSDTFRLGTQSNLLVGDNQTRNFAAMPWSEKHEFVIRTWGAYINDELLTGLKMTSPERRIAGPEQLPPIMKTIES